MKLNQLLTNVFSRREPEAYLARCIDAIDDPRNGVRPALAGATASARRSRPDLEMRFLGILKGYADLLHDAACREHGTTLPNPDDMACSFCNQNVGAGDVVAGPEAMICGSCAALAHRELNRSD